MQSVVILGVLLLTSIAAGCTDGAEPVQETDEAAAQQPPPPTMQPFNASFDWGFRAAVGTPLVAVQAGSMIDQGVFSGWAVVPEEAATMTVTVEGTCVPEPTCPLHLRGSVRGEEMAFASGTLPFTTTIEGPVSGQWKFTLHPAFDGSVVAEASGTVTVEGMYTA